MQRHCLHLDMIQTLSVMACTGLDPHTALLDRHWPPAAQSPAADAPVYGSGPSETITGSIWRLTHMQAMPLHMCVHCLHVVMLQMLSLVVCTGFGPHTALDRHWPPAAQSHAAHAPVYGSGSTQTITDSIWMMSICRQRTHMYGDFACM